MSTGKSLRGRGGRVLSSTSRSSSGTSAANKSHTPSLPVQYPHGISAHSLASSPEEESPRRSHSNSRGSATHPIPNKKNPQTSIAANRLPSSPEDESPLLTPLPVQRRYTPQSFARTQTLSHEEEEDAPTLDPPHIEPDSLPAMDPETLNPHQQAMLLINLLRMPNRELYCTVLSPTPKENTLWYD